MGYLERGDDRTFHPTFALKYFDGQQIIDVPLSKVTGEVYELADEIAMVADAVAGKGAVAASGEDGLWSVGMCLKAQESVQRGMAIHF